MLEISVLTPGRIASMFKSPLGIFRAAAAAALLLTFSGAPGVLAQDIPESQDPIVLAIHEWTGQHVTTYIAGHILEDMGYNVEYVTAAYLPSATGIADGNITVSLEMWDNNLGDFYPALMAEGKIEDIGDTGLDSREGWLYPKHVEDLCPGMPAWDAFIGCAELFATAETFPKGRFLDYPADWGDRATQLIVNQDLPFEAIPAGSEGSLVAELSASIQKKSPLVMMFWAPHWVLSTVETGWVDIPQDMVIEASMQKPRPRRSLARLPIAQPVQCRFHRKPLPDRRQNGRRRCRPLPSPTGRWHGRRT